MQNEVEKKRTSAGPTMLETDQKLFNFAYKVLILGRIQVVLLHRSPHIFSCCRAQGDSSIDFEMRGLTFAKPLRERRGRI